MEKIVAVIFRIKSLKLVRLLCLPFVNVKRHFRYKKYKRSQDSKYLKSLKNTKNGKKCYIIGNGPSLKSSDLDKLIDEDTFAFNRIFYMFDKTKWRPTYYMCVDPSVLQLNIREINNLELDNIFLSSIIKNKINKGKKVHYLYDKSKFKVNRFAFDEPYISEDVSDHFCFCFTVTFDALQLAIYMGYSEIYLLGVDHNYSMKVDSKGKIYKDESVKDYFEGLNKTSITLMNYEATTKAFSTVKEYCDKKNILVKNATRGGMLEVFDRIDFDSTIQM